MADIRSWAFHCWKYKKDVETLETEKELRERLDEKIPISMYRCGSLFGHQWKV